MRAHVLAVSILLVTALSGCENATAPDHAAARPSASVFQQLCDVLWANPVDGDWSDGTKWNRGYPPTSWDVACITVPGSYTVTIRNGEAWALYIGDSAATATPMIRIEPDTQIAWPPRQLESGEVIVQSGTVVMLPGASVDVGWLELHQPAYFQINGHNVIEHVMVDGGTFVSGGPTIIDSLESADLEGTVVIGKSYSLTMNFVDTWSARLWFDGGTITGDDRLFVNAASGGLDVRWSNGTLGTLLSDPDQPIVLLRGSSLYLSALADLYGMIDVDPAGQPITLDGGIPATAHVRVRRAQWAPVAPITMDGLKNRGRLEFTTSLSEALRIRGSLINTGTITVGPGRVDFEMDSLHNTGTITLSDSMRLTQGYLRNAGDIHVSGPKGDIVVAGIGDYLAQGSGAVHGTLFVEAGGKASGIGTINRVVSRGGTIDPGGIGARIGHLTINTLLLDSASQVIVEIADTTAGSYDRLHVTTNLKLDGALFISSMWPFQGGTCGQVVRPITHGRTGIRSGAFADTLGTFAGPGRRWRVHTTPTSIDLIGHDPYAVSVSPAQIATAEGGQAVPVSVCLPGTSPPSSSVMVDITSRFGQSSISPAQVQFSTANWLYPQAVSVSALDDAVAEPTVTDSIQLRLTSADKKYTGVPKTQIANTITDNDDGADLTVAHAGGPLAVNLNQQFEGLFRVTNNGPAASTGSTVVITPMAGLTYVSNSPLVSCTPGTGVVTCTVGPVAAGASTDFTILFRASSSGVHTNTATVTGNEGDHVPANNAGNWTVTVN